MAEVWHPTESDVAEYRQWAEERPEHVRVVATRFKPWCLYRLKGNGQRVLIYAYDVFDDKVTLRVVVSGRFNFISFERMVFGIDPSDLEECDLPPASEFVGAALGEKPDLIDRITRGELDHRDVCAVCASRVTDEERLSECTLRKPPAS